VPTSASAFGPIGSWPDGKVLKPKNRNFATPRPDVDADGFIR
jgi:hypothetical protein